MSEHRCQRLERDFQEWVLEQQLGATVLERPVDPWEFSRLRAIFSSDQIATAARIARRGIPGDPFPALKVLKGRAKVRLPLCGQEHSRAVCLRK